MNSEKLIEDLERLSDFYKKKAGLYRGVMGIVRLWNEDRKNDLGFESWLSIFIKNIDDLAVG